MFQQHKDQWELRRGKIIINLPVILCHKCIWCIIDYREKTQKSEFALIYTGVLQKYHCNYQDYTKVSEKMVRHMHPSTQKKSLKKDEVTFCPALMIYHSASINLGVGRRIPHSQPFEREFIIYYFSICKRPQSHLQRLVCCNIAIAAIVQRNL